MVLKWNNNIESIIHTIEKQSKLFKKIHSEVSISAYNKYSFYMNLAIIISPLSGLVSVLGNILGKDLPNIVYYNTSSAILSFFTTVIVAIIKFNQYDEVGYDHKSTSSKYTLLEQNIKRQLILGREERIPVKEYFSWVLKSYDDLFSNSPLLPFDYIKKYEKIIEELEKEFEKKELDCFDYEHKNNFESIIISIEENKKQKNNDSDLNLTKFDDENMLYNISKK